MNYYYITGTSRGIGEALARLLLENANTFVFGISRTHSIDHQNYRHVQLDLADERAVIDFSFEKHQDADRIILINNAGTLGEVKHVGDLSDESIIRSYHTNVIAPAVLMNKFIRSYRETAAEKMIINITSGAAQSPYDGWFTYSSSKAAIDMMSRVAALEQEEIQQGVKILGIAPGVVKTDMQKQIRETSEADFSRKKKFIDLFKQEQLYDARDVAKALTQIIDHPESADDVISRITL